MSLNALRSLLSIKLRLNANNQPLFEISPGDAMRLEDDVLRIDCGSNQFVSREDGLVGFSGLQFRPSLVYAPNRKFAGSAYSWVNERTSQLLGSAMAAAMPVYFWLSLTQGFNFTPMTQLQLCSNLYGLSLEGYLVGDKISELRRQLRGNLRSLKRGDQLDSYVSLMRIFECANSEAKTGRILCNLGYDVQLGIHPDLLVDGIGVEVKNVLQSFAGTSDYGFQLRQRAQQIAKEQNAQIVIFDAAQYFNFHWHKHMQPLSAVMKKAMWQARKGRISAILLSHSPSDQTPRGLIL